MTLAIGGTGTAPADDLGDDVAQVRASTRSLLVALLAASESSLDAPAATGLGTRRHVVARLAAQSDRMLARLERRREPAPDATLVHAPIAELVDRVASSLGAVLGALVAPPVATPRHVILAAASEQVAWLELTHVDLGDGYGIADVPDAALDALAAHFHDRPSSPFAALVAP